MQIANICRLGAQNSSSVVFTYDNNGNRTSVQYVMSKIDDDESPNDTINDRSGDKNGDFATSGNDTIGGINISIYPNPTSGYLVLSTDSYSQSRTINVRLLSLQGIIIDEREITSDRAEFDLSGSPAGVYLLSIICDEEKHLWKIVKK